MQTLNKIVGEESRINKDNRCMILQSQKHRIIASIDKHTHSSYLYALDVRTGAILADKNIFNGDQEIMKQLNSLGAKKDILVLSEAGNQGFSFSRHLKKNGYTNQLIAPSSIPIRGKERKTDRDDAIENLHYHMSGLLRYVWIPHAEAEDCRELMRYRYEQIWQLAKQKQKINSLTKRHGLEFTLTKSTWTKKHYSWLKTVEILPLTRLVLDSLVAELERLNLKILEIDKELDGAFSQNPKNTKLKNYYELLPGIGRIGSMTLVLEGHDLQRFPRPSSLMNYTGLIPDKKASGEKDPHLRITKAGNKYLRLALVGAAKFYRDRRYLNSQKALAEFPEPLGTFIERCQNRLNSRYRHLCSKGKHSNKAKVAVARELCGFLWELVVKLMPVLGEEYVPVYKKAA